VLAELPKLTFAERKLLFRRALELDETDISVQDQALVEDRLAEDRRNPKSAVSLETMKARVRARR
jgi:hypothetical protein